MPEPSLRAASLRQPGTIRGVVAPGNNGRVPGGCAPSIPGTTVNDVLEASALAIRLARRATTRGSTGHGVKPARAASAVD
jgi:hypothetical protein